MRDFALPFDWVVSNIKSLQKCFETNFGYFHKNLTFNFNKTRLVDQYGFQFPHDYPLTNMDNFENNVGEGVFGEERGKFISEKWSDYYALKIVMLCNRVALARSRLTVRKDARVVTHKCVFKHLNSQV